MMKRKPLRQVWAILMVILAISFGSSAMSQPPRGNGGPDEKRTGPPPRFELGQVFPPSLEEELNLTPAQEEELDAIKQELKAKLDKLLTDEQKLKIERFRPRGPGGQRGPEGREPPPPPPGGRGAARPGRPSTEHAASSDSEPSVQAKLPDLPSGVTRVPVVFSGGHETDPRDGGRPVVLIAAALEVAPEVFREAFSRVRPARGGAEPEPAQVRQNKAVLMEALGKHGVTNERLDTVSNYYRYPPGRNSIWTNKPAVANALIKEGVVIGYELISGGSGYSSVPTVSVPKVKSATAKVEISYGKLMESNGSVSAISVPQDKAN